MFIGDKRMKSVYKAFINQLQDNDETPDNESAKIIDEKENLNFVDGKLRLRVSYIYENEISKYMIDEFKKWENDINKPSAIVVGCTYSNFQRGNLTKNILSAYSKNLTKIVRPLESLVRKKTKVLWKLEDPVNEYKLNNDWKNVKNDYIEKYNQAVYETLEYTNIKIWSSSKLISSGLVDDMKDGYSLSSLGLRHVVQILLNMYCNDNMNYYDGTCCSSAESYTILQVVTFALLGVW